VDIVERGCHVRLVPKTNIRNTSVLCIAKGAFSWSIFSRPCGRRDSAQSEGNARPHNTTLIEKRFAMPDFESSIVTSIDSLQALYARPIERIAKKQLDHVNEAGRAFIAASPFLVLATGGRQGLDCSPKGDQPGFVEVAEDGRNTRPSW
jgi:hypothetical protein